MKIQVTLYQTILYVLQKKDFELFTKWKILDVTNLKAFTDDIFMVAKMTISIF